MLRLAVHTIRFRVGGFAASFVALTFGAAIVMACGGLMETGIRLAVPPQRLAAAPIVVTGDLSYPERIRLDAELVETVRSMPGVTRAVPDVSFPVAVPRDDRPLNDGMQLQGHGWASAELASYRLTTGSVPDERDEVVLDAASARQAGLGVGDRVELAVRGASERFRVVGVAGGGPVDGTGAFFSDAAARRLVGESDQVDAIAVVTAPQTDTDTLAQRIDAALRGHPATSLMGDERGLAEFPDAAAAGETLIILSAVFGGLAIMVAVFVVASTLGLSIQLRQREMALLRAIGTTPGQLRRMIVGEAMFVWVLASALAYPLGRHLGAWLLDQIGTTGAIPPVIAFHQGWIPTAGAAAISLLTALTAALVAARSAALTRPADALAEASLQRRWLSWVRLVSALVCLGGGIALGIVTMTVLSGPVAASTAGPSAMLWAAGLALLGPGITGVLAAVLRWPMRAVSGLAGRLAMSNAQMRHIRVAGAVTPIMLVTGLATALIYLQTSQTSVAERAFAERLRADAVLTSSAGGLPLDLVGDVRRLPGVAHASALVASTGYFESEDDPQDRDVPLQGISADGAAQTLAIPVTVGTLSDLRDNTVALSTRHAEDLDRGVGDTITMRLGDGAEVDLTLVAMFSTRPGFETALVPASLLVEHTTTGLLSQILVRAGPDTDTGQLTATLGALADRQPGLQVSDRSAVTAVHSEAEQTGAWVNYLLVGMIIGYTVVSLINTLVVATSERRREFALQRLIGSTRGQVMRMVSVEAGFVALAGTVLGGVVAATTIVPFGIALSGSPVPQGPLWIYPAVIGCATLLTFVATLVPAWITLRSRPTEVLAAFA